MRIRNLTPHEVNVYSESGDILLGSYESEGIARVSVVTHPQCSLLEDNEAGSLFIPVVERHWGKVEGLPEPEEGVVNLISSLVLAQVPNRTDCYAPDTGPDSVLRDEKGRIIGVRRLTRDAPNQLVSWIHQKMDMAHRAMGRIDEENPVWESHNGYFLALEAVLEQLEK